MVPLIDAEANPHGYQPRPDDMLRTKSLDVLIVNAIGHDEWAKEIVSAAGRGKDLPLIMANAGVALIPIRGTQGGERVVNPHTFVSTTAAIQQAYHIANELGKLDPDNAVYFIANARRYGARIRRLRADFMAKFAKLDTSRFSAATAHAGYDYLFQELGLQVKAVIEPRHGVDPTARQLADTVDQIRKAGVTVLFAEKYFTGNLAETIRAETGVKVFSLSHITGGAYTPEKFEVEMRENLETVAEAIRSTSH
ncbi:metal ABC transporter solute-binding protein, Zn/Mn family [Sinorhizobium meliloti]|uniref:metal ABC transporter solute-binding protein, Zn/Mn family n=1 Tax=Rhizobium meliloti TaxID=382 RepID=UPI001F2E5C2F|nr:zinc ABC transporter substrate-binding protein [Sinorhizobium meliloti]